MVELKSYACGDWHLGEEPRRSLTHAVTGEVIGTTGSRGLDFGAMLEYGRAKGGPALRKLTFPERAKLLKTWAGVLNDHLEELYEIAHSYGATKTDAWMDIEGGTGTLFVYGSKGKRELPEKTYYVDGDPEMLSKKGGFAGRHFYVPLEGVAVQINAYNFPAWGMLEKLAPATLAGVPSIVKPATNSSWLTFRIVELLIESGTVPEGVLQLITGSTGALLDHLTCQDIVSFTGSADTGQKLKANENVIRNSVRFNMEADSLNCVLLGSDVEPGSPAFEAFAEEIVREMTVKAGQKCTAIRRILVPKDREEAVIEAVSERLARITIGDPAHEEVKMGPLVDQSAVQWARDGLARLLEEAEIVHGDPDAFAVVGADKEKGAFFPPILLRATDPAHGTAVHEVEVFGPVATVMAFENLDQGVELARMGGGSLVASAYTEDEGLARKLALRMAPWHGRLLLMNADAAGESTGHGTAMPQLVHGGPGRAGGGEELGGIRSVFHYMQRTAIQGAPDRLDALV